MRNISFDLIQKIAQLVGAKFDSVTMDFLGIIPKISKDKKLTISSNKNSLTSLFFQALGDRKADRDEEEVLKGLLNVANSYMEAIKTKTVARVVNEVTAHSQELVMGNKSLKASDIKEIVQKELDLSNNHVRLIANAESQRSGNTGTALNISKIGKVAGNNDPTVFFIVVHDEVTGPYEYILHTLPDRITPRYWKLSEITSSYYTPGGQFPSLCGLHINCRCRITYLAKGFGHVDGKISYISPDYDGFEEQRGKYGLPNVPAKISRSKKNKKNV